MCTIYKTQPGEIIQNCLCVFVLSENKREKREKSENLLIELLK
jgi:hypothetical protein